MKADTGLARKPAPESAERRKSPSVRMPESLPRAPLTRAMLPLFALVIARMASWTVTVSLATGSRLPLRMMSPAFRRRTRPRLPAGWYFAKSSRVSPRASRRTIARASPRARAAVVLAVGASLRGQASRFTR
jgi:hypothetical protein